MFKIGDKVKVTSKRDEYYGKVGKITILQDYGDSLQIARVAFSPKYYDYIDVTSLSLKKVK